MSLLIYSPSTHRYAEWREAFAEAAPSIEITFGIESLNSDTKYVLAWKPPHGFLATVPELRAIFSMGAGIDHITADPALPDVPLIRQRDAGMGQQMAEYALYAALHYQRDFDLMRIHESASKWQPAVSRVRPRLKIGILGMGTLGAKVADALVANGFPVSGWSRSAKDIAQVKSYSGQSELGSFLAETELLICLLPDTDKTRGIINQDLLAQLPQGAAIANMARGALVVDEDLLEAIDSGHIRGAMLDVFHQEPLARVHAYWQHPKVFVTPHIAAETVYRASAQQVAHDIERMEQGLAPVETVDVKRGY